MSAVTSDTFCSAYSRKQEEPLAGTATRVNVWLLLEYQGPFSRKATDETELPATARDHLESALAKLPLSRLQFIRRPLGDREGVTFSVAVPDEIHPRLTTFHLNTLDEITDIDIAAMVQGDLRYKDYETASPIVIVCVNGKRDRCCALRGVAAAQRLSEKLGDQVWTTTHLGGHRYAANGVVLPQGIVMGHLDEVDPDEFAKDLHAGRIHLSALRGRAMYEKSAQAAEFYLRQKTGVRDFDAFRLTDFEDAESNLWTITFAETASGATHRLQIARTVSDFTVVSSCGDEEAKHTHLYNLIGYKKS